MNMSDFIEDTFWRPASTLEISLGLEGAKRLLRELRRAEVAERTNLEEGQRIAKAALAQSAKDAENNVTNRDKHLVFRQGTFKVRRPF